MNFVGDLKAGSLNAASHTILKWLHFCSGLFLASFLVLSPVLAHSSHLQLCIAFIESLQLLSTQRVGRYSVLPFTVVLLLNGLLAVREFFNLSLRASLPLSPGRSHTPRE